MWTKKTMLADIDASFMRLREQIRQLGQQVELIRKEQARQNVAGSASKIKTSAVTISLGNETCTKCVTYDHIEEKDQWTHFTLDDKSTLIVRTENVIAMVPGDDE